MKILTAILILITSNAFGQSGTLDAYLPFNGYTLTNEPQGDGVDSPSIIVIYKESKDYMWYGNGVASPSNKTITRIIGFANLADVLKWTNGERYNQKVISIEPNKIVAIYDISNAKEIHLKLKTENKVIPKHIEVKEEKWVDKYYEIE